MSRRWLLFVVLLVTASAGCFGTAGPEGGQLVIDNEGGQNRTVAVAWDDERTSLTVPAGSKRVLTLTNSPGTYTVGAVVDDDMSVNHTISYSPGGGDGTTPAGPVPVLVVEDDRVYFSRSYD